MDNVQPSRLHVALQSAWLKLSPMSPTQQPWLLPHLIPGVLVPQVGFSRLLCRAAVRSPQPSRLHMALQSAELK